MFSFRKSYRIITKIPEHKLEIVYMYIRFADSQTDSTTPAIAKNKESDHIKILQGFQCLISFAGTLP